jgi:hypothetical protein
MSPKVSTVVVAELRSAPGSFVLLREDSSDTENFYVWCGQYGWLPDSDLAKTLQHIFHSVKEAERATKKLVKLPLQKRPSSHNE